MALNKKERVLKAIRFKEIDRLPMVYKGTPPLSKALMRYFNIGEEDDTLRFLKNYKKLIEAINADFWSLGVGGYFSIFTPNYIGPEIDFLDGQYFAAIGIKTGTKTLEANDFTYLTILDNPLAAVDSHEKVKGYLTGKLDLFDYKNSINIHINNGKNSPYYNNKKALEILDYKSFEGSDDEFLGMGAVFTSPFMTCCYLRGMENFLMDIAGNKKMAETLISEVCEFMLEFNRRSIEQTNIKKIESFFTWDDVSTQLNSIISPDIFKKYFLPFWQKLITLIKSKNIIFVWHCCGNVNDILPMMIDAGIDVFEVFQTSARDMEIEKFYKKFGKNVCIHGGIDVQKLLVFGNPKLIKEEVNKIKRLWGTGGGIILSPSHEALPETPIENILAVYQTT